MYNMSFTAYVNKVKNLDFSKNYSTDPIEEIERVKSTNLNTLGNSTSTGGTGTKTLTSENEHTRYCSCSNYTCRAHLRLLQGTYQTTIVWSRYSIRPAPSSVVLPHRSRVD